MEAGVMTMAAKMDLTNKFSHKHYVMLRKNSPKAADEYISKFRDIKNNNFSVEINGEEVTTTEVIQEPEVDAEDKEKDELVAKLRAAGQKLASKKWSIETLRKKVAELS